MVNFPVVSLIKKRWPVVAITFIWMIVVWTNYTPGTWLTGWDNLHPEIDLSLNLYRSFFSVWQDYQGLGLLGGIAHASEITRQILLIPFSLLLPTSMVRYAWTFLMLLIGPLGTYFLLKQVFYSKHKKPFNFTAQLVLLTGAVFYLFNLATVQYFYVPLETFSSFYGFLPWLLYAVLRYFHKPQPKLLLQYAGISLLATSAFHVQTLFVTFSVVLLFLSVEQIVREKALGFWSVMKLGITTLLVHSFWLLPVVYFTITNSGATVQAKQTLIATAESQLQSQAAGSIENIVQLKGYWFDLTDLDITSNKTVYILEFWKQHLSQPVIGGLLFVIFAIVLFGYLFSSRNTKTSFVPAFLFILLFSLCMLSAGNGFLGIIYKVLENNLPLFGQIFRVAFTKWSMVTGLCFAIGITGFLFFLSNLFKQHKIVVTAFSTLFITIFLITTLPVFSGQLIYDRVQLQIPSEYFQLFNHLKLYPSDKKILHLPVHSFWGWQFNTWGYRGSGFLWYGVHQPIIDRNFDVWSDSNEQLFHQLDTAFSHNDAEHLQKIIDKYQISLALVDDSLVTENNIEQKLSPYSSAMLEQIGAEVVWKSGALTLYKLPELSQTETAQAVNVQHSRNTRKDIVYQDLDNYYQSDQPVYTYPFAELNNIQMRNITMENDTLIITAELPQNLSGHKLEIPSREIGQNYTTNANLIYQGNQFQIIFENQIRFKIGQHIFELPQLAPITATTSESFESLTVTISEQTFTLKQNSQLQSIPLNLTVGEPIIIDLINSQNIFEEDGKPTVLISDVTTQSEDSAWQNLLVPSSFQLPPAEEKVEVLISTSPLIFNLQQWGFQQNCDALQRGTIEKHTNNSLYVSYRANNFASNCDGFSLSQLSNHQDHIIYIESQNLSGNRLRFFIENLSNFQTELEEIISEDRQFFAMLGSPQLTDDGYYFTLMTKSLGQLSENQVSEIKIFPTNIDLITQTKITLNQTNPKQVYSVEKSPDDLNFLFKASVPENQLLTLSDSFNPGWLAFPSWKFWQPYEHVKYNGWANAWIMETNELTNRPTDQPTTTTILFWPQLLSFFGYGLLIVTCGYLTAKQLKKN